MFARFLGRQGTSSKEETPEQEAELNNNEIAVTLDPKRGSQEPENNQQVSVTKKSEAEPATDVNDITVEISSTQVPKFDGMKAPAAFIFPFEKRAIWPSDLAVTFPTKLKESVQARESKLVFRSLEEKMIGADQRREDLLMARSDSCAERNHQIAHALLVRKDVEKSIERSESVKIDKKIDQARERREMILGEKRLSATDSITPKSSISDEYEPLDVPYNRMEQAVRFRSLYLQEVSKRARKNVEYARMVASEVASAEEEASTIIEEMLEQRLQRAEVRRTIVLDRRRLAAGRHGNYVKSVYLTNRYMDRRSAQMIQHNLDAATFRREVKLEEIKSNARQQNLSAQFKSTCAYRMLDAKWLNYALKSTAAQTTAKMRRDMRLDALHQRLHEAELRRADVMAAHRLIVSNRADLDELNQRLANATYRRELHLYERRASIQERANIIRGRKAAAKTISRRAARKAIENKLNAAKMRREAFLEARRSICATRNWHVKVCAHQQKEKYVEDCQVGFMQWEDKLQAAAQRRIEEQHPIFAQLTALRVKRAHDVRQARLHIEARIYAKKQTYTKLRLSAMNQMQMNKTFDRLSRVKRVQSNRQFMDTFYKQVISNTTMARQRGAELRRALYNDAVKAAATETIERSAAARERLAFREEEARELLNLKLQTAQARRAEARSERVSTALWFQGKVAMARKRLDEETESYREYLNEVNANADLRRSILLTRGLQTNVDRSVRWIKKQKLIRQHQEEQRVFQDIKAQKAEARREAAMLRKIEVARISSSRVTVARLEKRAEDVVDAAIRTAISKTMSKNAEERRQEHLEDIQSSAASQVSHAKDIAKYQKELQQVKAEVTLQQSKLRMLQTSKRRENLLTQRKLGQSTIGQLQPYAGLQVIGHAIPLIPNSA